MMNMFLKENDNFVVDMAFGRLTFQWVDSNSVIVSISQKSDQLSAKVIKIMEQSDVSDATTIIAMVQLSIASAIAKS